ncbi:PI-type proteinase [Rhodococcus sp. ARC_M6]|uniref:PI-type proteinase n=1 Tax=Rhodococcus sp. ARC_M6 TaxID=2928852 RepID=UPI001FB1EFC1|nr:PI-type proteinase [Rhodococcus sp. ARC_M6]MCJ0905901.1 PI-type proteinase [Rhodococcus sp. ARC_M6]
MIDEQAGSRDNSPDDVETVTPDSGPDHDNADSDVQSDPSSDQTWSDEGGATKQGPATDPHDG